MQWKIGAVLCLLGAFVGCGATPDGAKPGDDAADNVGVATSAAATCVTYTSTIADHIHAGRAFEQDVVFFIFKFPEFYATQSDELIGSSASQTVTLYPKQGGGYTTNASLCQLAECGNGVLESPPEQCDGTLFQDGSAPECYQLGSPDGNPWVSGLIKCTADCKFDTSDCKHAVCGNGIIEGDERCDGATLGGSSACTDDVEDGVFTGGQLKCKSDCSGYDLSGCTTLCGNGVIDAGEDCDGTLRTAQYAGKTCATTTNPVPTWPFAITVPYASGNLVCNNQCKILASSCKPQPGCYIVPISGSQPALGVQCF